MLDELLGGLLTGDMSLSNLLTAKGTDILFEQLEKYIVDIIQSMANIVVLISIPFLIFAIAYCFFGIKIFRILLLISGIFGGGLIGAAVIGIAMQSGGGAVLGFLIGGAIGGLLAWFAYKVFLFIQAFFTGFWTTGLILLVLTRHLTVSLVLGIIVGMALGVLIFIYTKLFVMIMTAYKGAGTIASILSLLFIASSAYKPVYFLLLVVFTAAGFFVQYKFFGDVSMEGSKGKNRENANRQERYVIVGIDGMYKGFEFDLDDTMVFGRDAESCNVVFPDTCSGVSRIQCQIGFDRGENMASIVDKFSSYGTTLNGKRLEINAVEPLKDGDVIMFGENNVFKLEVR